MNNHNCPICDSVIKKDSSKIEGYQKGLFFDIAFCNNCDLSYVISRNDNSDIYNLIYSNSKIIPGYSRYEEYKEEIKKQSNPLKYLANKEGMYWTISKYIENGEINLTDKIMEVGCGLGYLTYSLKKAGFSITGIDISNQAISQAKSMFGDYYKCENILGYSERTKDRYDIIIMTEVIEHLVDPISFLIEIKKMLSPNGKVILTTPDKSFLNDNGLIWSTDLPPVHFWWFSKKSLRFLANRIKVDIDFIDFTGFNRSTGNIQFNHNQERSSILDYDGSVITPAKENKNIIFLIKKIVKRVYLNTLKRNFSESRIIGAILKLNKI